MMRKNVAVALFVVGLMGCGGDDDGSPPAATATPTPSRTVAASTPTRTATSVPIPTPAAGANVTFVGLVRADYTIIDPTETDTSGRSVYVRSTGSGFGLVIEAKPGANGSPVGTSAYDSNSADPSVRPDLQIEVSRALGNGSSAVCDNQPGEFGGVPGIDPASYAETQPISDALNDLGCRFNDGTGSPQGRPQTDACVLFPDGQFGFVDTSSTLQFCAFVTQPLTFPVGDTVLTVRVRDQSGAVGPAAQIVVRISSTPPTPTVTPTPVGTPTVTPTLGIGANIGFMGILRADETVVPPTEFDANGRPVFVRPAGSGFILVVDAKPGTNGAAVGKNAFDYDPTDPTVRPDLQIQVSRALGNGSTAVCDNTPENFGGIPGIFPPSFAETADISGALNDLGCRVNDGTGNPQGRDPSEACVLQPDGTFGPADPAATVEFCVSIAVPFAFQPGETIVTARVRDASGAIGPERQIVIRVGSS